MQCPHHLILVHPRDFAFNMETAVSNAFQQEIDIEHHLDVVHREFNGLLNLLTRNHIAYTVFDSPKGVEVPDAVFPNNWFAVMPDGKLIVFPMFAPNRRNEVNPILLEKVEDMFQITAKIDLSAEALQRRPLEGTGSIVFDHDTKTAFACESDRTHIGLFEQLCGTLGYTPVSFFAADLKGIRVYHTNVAMSIGARTVIACTECMLDPVEQAMIRKTIEASGKTLVEINYAQMNRFCGNALQVTDQQGQLLWLMSDTAYRAFEPAQLQVLEQSGRVIHTDLTTIETLGGGSLRCMLAGIHAPYRS